MQRILFLYRFLDWALDPSSGIRRSDASSVFRNVGSTTIGRPIVFSYMQTNWDKMVAL